MGAKGDFHAATPRRQGAGFPHGVLQRGGIVIVGGDFSAILGWMEGALESAEQAVAAIERLR
jgi:monoamine oxidase